MELIKGWEEWRRGVEIIRGMCVFVLKFAGVRKGVGTTAVIVCFS